MGSDLYLAWPSAEIAVMGAKGAVEVLHRRETDPARRLAARAGVRGALPQPLRGRRPGGRGRGHRPVRHPTRSGRRLRDARDEAGAPRPEKALQHTPVGSAPVADSISITDNRTGETFEVPIVDGGVDATEWRKRMPGRLVLRPGADDHRRHVERHHLPRRRGGHPPRTGATRSSSWPSTPPTSRWPTSSSTASCPPRSSTTRGSTTSRTTRSSTRTCASGSSRASTTTPTRWGCSSPRIAALSTFYPDAKDIHDPRHAAPADRRGSSPRCRRWPPPATASASGMPFVYPDNSLELHRELPVDALEGGRAPLRRQPRARQGARRALHPPRRPRAELRHHRDARRRLSPRRPLRQHRRRGRRPLRPAPRRGQRGRDPHAHRDRLDRERPRVHRGREGGQGQAPGLRPPRLQELRPAGEDHQAAPPTRSSRSPARARSSTSR